MMLLWLDSIATNWFSDWNMQIRNDIFREEVNKLIVLEKK